MGPGILEFDAKGRFGADDSTAFLSLLIDGQQIFTFQRDMSFYERFEINIPEGDHEIQWRFVKDIDVEYFPSLNKRFHFFLRNISYRPFSSDRENTLIKWMLKYNPSLSWLDYSYWAGSDLDGDGVVALEEFSFGSDPNAYDEVFFDQTYLWKDSGKVHPIYNYSRNKLMGDDTMFIQSSSNLTDWEVLKPEEYSFEVLSESEVQEVLSVEIIPVEDEQRFYRFVFF